MVTIELPVFIMIPRKTKADRKLIINLNTYRNTHYVINNQLKHLYKESLEGVLSGMKLECPLKLHFILTHPIKKKIDRANVLSIHEKFFCDAMTEYGVIPDDNDKYITSSYYTSEIGDTIKVTVNIEENMPKKIPDFLKAIIEKKSKPVAKVAIAVKPGKKGVKIATKVAVKPMAKKGKKSK